MTQMQTTTDDQRHQAGQTPKDPPKLTLRMMRDWLSGDIDIRLPRGWVVAAATVAALLLIIALD